MPYCSFYTLESHEIYTLFYLTVLIFLTLLTDSSIINK